MRQELIDYFKSGAALKFDALGEPSKLDLQMSAAVILVETALADKSYVESEHDTIVEAMVREYELEGDDAEDVALIAKLASDHKIKIAQFIDKINSHFNLMQRQVIYAHVWRVIKADGVVHPLELQASTELGDRLCLQVKEEIEARRMIIEGKL